MRQTYDVNKRVCLEVIKGFLLVVLNRLYLTNILAPSYQLEVFIYQKSSQTIIIDQMILFYLFVIGCLLLNSVYYDQVVNKSRDNWMTSKCPTMWYFVFIVCRLLFVQRLA